MLWERASALPGVTTHDHSRVVELIVEDSGDGPRCSGARFLSDDGAVSVARARLVLLATGGAGQVYRETTNPHVATGDGVAMAYRAGAAVADLEFVQFHPTALSVPNQPRFLLSEALRGEGARLVNGAGEAFMARYHPAGDLAPRDRVSRAIVREEERTGGPVFLSLEHLDADFVHERFPLISDACRLAGLDLARDPIPVGPAAHYVMGGVRTDLAGRTTIAGLYAAGEVACTGVHGANRLASNSLLEGLVFGARAGRAMRTAVAGPAVAQGFGPVVAQGFSPASGRPDAPRNVDINTSVAQGFSDGPGSSDQPPLKLRRSADQPPPKATAVRRSDAKAEALAKADGLRYADLMWRDVGLFRDRAGLERALSVLEDGWRALETRLRDGPALDAAGWRTASILTVGRLIARAALRREESRGGHYRSDFPDRDDVHWKRRITESAVTSCQ